MTNKRVSVNYNKRLQLLKEVYGNISDKELAQKLNVSQSTIYRVRTGKTKTINSKLKSYFLTVANK